MLKNVLAIILAVQIAAQPAQAGTTLPPMDAKQKETFCQAFVGLDDAVFIAFIVWVGLKIYADTKKMKEQSEKIEKLKTEARKRCGS